MYKFLRSPFTLALALLLSAPMMASAAPFAASAKHAATSPAANANKIDINTASLDQLKAFHGIGDAYAARIFAGRPYATKSQLVTRHILPAATYNKIKDQIIATHPKK